jgi:hypothetical protein
MISDGSAPPLVARARRPRERSPHEPCSRDCARGAPLAPKSHSSKATRFTILAPSLASTRRQQPHREHRSSRGRVSALTMPTWPHCWQAILSSIMCTRSKFGGGRKSPRELPGAKFTTLRWTSKTGSEAWDNRKLHGVGDLLAQESRPSSLERCVADRGRDRQI